MTEYFICWGIQRYEDGAVVSCDNLELASEHAWAGALELLDSYGGLHGYPYHGPCSDCDGSGIIEIDNSEEECPECLGTGEISWEDFTSQADSWIVYQAFTLEEALNLGLVNQDGNPNIEELADLDD